MSKGHVAVDGAICRCNFGVTLDTLVVQSQSKSYINDSAGSKKLIANTMDIGIPFMAKTFGQCALQPTPGGLLPCVPSLTQWINFYDKVTLSNQGQILTENSKAICAIAGSPCVQFSWHGQTAAVSNDNISQSDSEAQSHLNPLIDMKKLRKVNSIPIKINISTSL